MTFTSRSVSTSSAFDDVIYNTLYFTQITYLLDYLHIEENYSLTVQTVRRTGKTCNAAY